MLATAGPAPSGEGWAVEFRWDGIRVIAAGGGRVRLTSRNGIDLTAGYPEIAGGRSAAGLIDVGPVVLDGELVVLDPDGRASFERLQQRMHVRNPGPELVAHAPVVFYVFDVLNVARRSLLGEAYDGRREMLTGLGLDRLPQIGCPAATPMCRRPGCWRWPGRTGLEGVVSKRRRSRYEPGRRSTAWIKTPLIITMEVLIGGWTAGSGRRCGTIGALLLGAYDTEGSLRYLGRVGTGFTETMLTDLAARRAPARGAGEPVRGAVARGGGPWRALGAPAVGRGGLYRTPAAALV